MKLEEKKSISPHIIFKYTDNLSNYKYFSISPSIILLSFKFGPHSFSCYLFCLGSFF